MKYVSSKSRARRGSFETTTQLKFTCSDSTIETKEKDLKYVQS